MHLDPLRAAEVLTCFTDRVRNHVMIRIATLEGIRQAVKRQ
ncbi:hypothetical protein [Paraburkholderia sp. PGU19]|nr:hypothetical protein [Paraburkholderia sp. PGU19]